MNESAKQDTLELEVSNFGPIVEAKMDLRPLTVFVGPSNTGKSYLAILIYALHRYFSDGWSGRRRFSRNPLIFRDVGAKPLPRETINDLAGLGERMLSDKKESLSKEGIVLPDSTTDFIRSRLSEKGGGLGNEIGRCFGMEEVGALIRKGSRGGARIDFRSHNANELDSIDHRLSINTQTDEFKTIIPEGTPVRINTEGDDYSIRYFHNLAEEMFLLLDKGEKRLSFFARRVLENLTDHVRTRIVAPLDLPAFYLPADRTGVMHAHNVVVRALIGSAAMTGLRQDTPTPMLSGVLADFLEQLIGLAQSTYQRRNSRHDLGAPIEKNILQGSVRANKSEVVGYPHFTYRPDGWKNNLSLMHASSMVSELAPVVLYLRHIVRPGNVLIIEEPESHLHPAMQVEFTRQIAALVNSGIRVIVTTHSEWVLEELANIVRRSELPGAEYKKTINDKIALKPDQVGAWLFKQSKRPKGSIIEEVKLDDETGLYPADYDLVSEKLYNDSVNIFNRTQSGNAK